jgi:hypothetical protein
LWISLFYPHIHPAGQKTFLGSEKTNLPFGKRVKQVKAGWMICQRRRLPIAFTGKKIYHRAVVSRDSQTEVGSFAERKTG